MSAKLIFAEGRGGLRTHLEILELYSEVTAKDTVGVALPQYMPQMLFVIKVVGGRVLSVGREVGLHAAETTLKLVVPFAVEMV